MTAKIIGWMFFVEYRKWEKLAENGSGFKKKKLVMDLYLGLVFWWYSWCEASAKVYCVDSWWWWDGREREREREKVTETS